VPDLRDCGAESVNPLMAAASMHGNVFALAIIGTAWAALAILKAFGKRPDGKAVFFAALLAVATFFVLAFAAFSHLCSRGGPFGAVALGAVSAGALRATVDKKACRRVMWGCWLILTVWGTGLCHLDGYIGNPAYGKWLAQRPFDDLACVQNVLRKASESRKGLYLPEGWVEESWRAGTGEDFSAPTTGLSGTPGRYWHTWFTGVFSLETHDYGIWCPGGPLESCIESVEIRPR